MTTCGAADGDAADMPGDSSSGSSSSPSHSPGSFSSGGRNSSTSPALGKASSSAGMPLQQQDSKKKKKVVVVGGGWAGFGAADHLARQLGYDVTLLDASPSPGGLAAGWRTPQGRAVEAGIKGFWRDYPNIYRLLGELPGPWPLTDWSTSGFWGRDGSLITQAPVFSKQQRLPTILGQFVHTFNLFE